MRYDNSSASGEEKEAHLELLLAQSDTLVDAISLASLKSAGELAVLADKGRSMLKDVAYEDRPVVLKGPYSSVPLIGRREEQETEDVFENSGEWLFSQLELQLEMNLAVLYTVLIDTRCQTALVEPRGQLIKKAHDKLCRNSMFGKMQFAQRFGAIRYLDASAFALGIHSPAEDETVSLHYTMGIDFLLRAQNIAQYYSRYHQFMAFFNLGRMEFLWGEDKSLAASHLYTALEISRNTMGGRFLGLAQHYLDAARDGTQRGAVIDDPPEHKARLMGLVTESLRPEEKPAQGIVLL